MGIDINNPDPNDQPTRLPGGSITPDWANAADRRNDPLGVHGELMIPASMKKDHKNRKQMNDHVMQHLHKQFNLHRHVVWDGAPRVEAQKLPNGDITISFEVHPKWE